VQRRGQLRLRQAEALANRAKLVRRQPDAMPITSSALRPHVAASRRVILIDVSVLAVHLTSAVEIGFPLVDLLRSLADRLRAGDNTVPFDGELPAVH
jgi:hypothetical protein